VHFIGGPSPTRKAITDSGAGHLHWEGWEKLSFFCRVIERQADVSNEMNLTLASVTPTSMLDTFITFACHNLACTVILICIGLIVCVGAVAPAPVQSINWRV
jgi:hypothetical protein